MYIIPTRRGWNNCENRTSEREKSSLCCSRDRKRFLGGNSWRRYIGDVFSNADNVRVSSARNPARFAGDRYTVKYKKRGRSVCRDLRVTSFAWFISMRTKYIYCIPRVFNFVVFIPRTYFWKLLSGNCVFLWNLTMWFEYLDKRIYYQFCHVLSRYTYQGNHWNEYIDILYMNYSRVYMIYSWHALSYLCYVAMYVNNYNCR